MVNVLFILTDQLRADCLGAFGNTDIDSKNIDSIAEDGVRFTNSFCTSPVCTPSRYSILTSMYPHQHQGYTNDSSIPYTYMTFPEILKSHGYDTEVIGKMHTNPSDLNVGYTKVTLAEQTEPGRYEDDYHKVLQSKGLTDRIDEYDQVLKIRERAPESYWNSFGAMESTLSEQDHSTNWIGDQAIDAVRQWKGDKNLLTLSFIKPHHPFDPPYPWSTMYNPEKLQLLPGWIETPMDRDLDYHEGYFPHDLLTVDKLKQVMAYYYANISFIDYKIGQIIGILKEKKLYDDTLIVFSSDHGEFMGHHHMLLKSNHMYDPIVKVPLIIKYPISYNRLGTSDELANNIDIGPTILEIAGIDKHRDMAGNSLLSKSDREFVITEDNRGSAYMIRSKRYKLLSYNTEDESLFFDLETDPYEFENLYFDESYKDTVVYFEKVLARFVLFDHPAPIYQPPNKEKI